MLNKVFGAVGNFCYRFRAAISIIGVLLFAAVCFMQSKATISYTNPKSFKVTDVFPIDDTLVLVYDNEDEDQINSLIDYLSENEHVTSLRCYANTLGMQMTSSEIAGIAGMDEMFVNALLYMKENGAATDGLTLVQFINFISSDELLNDPAISQMMDSDVKEQISQYAAIINGIAEDTSFDADMLAAVFGMQPEQVQTIFSMSNMDSMTIDSFLSAMQGMAAQRPEMLTPEQAQSLQMLQGISGLVKQNTAYTPEQLLEIMPLRSEKLNEATLSLLYLLYYGNSSPIADPSVGLYDFFQFLCSDVITDERFAPLLSEDIKTQLLSNQGSMEDGKAQLVGPTNSRLIMTLDYELESQELTDFYDDLTAKLNGLFTKEYYMVGNSAMSYELSQTFQKEYMTITVVAAVVIFLIVCLTFRKFSVPALLVLIIEFSVFITMSVMAIAHFSMYFIALIIVQCILMGSMADYGILLVSYYQETRREYPKEKALPVVLSRAASAILTSALIMIAITFILGSAMSGAVGRILLTLGIGSLSATLLVLFYLPSLLVIFDKAIMYKRERIH